MTRWFRLSLMALVLLVVWGFGKSQPLAEVKPEHIRFTKANNGVITEFWVVQKLAATGRPMITG